MSKEKNKESAKADVPFPEGAREIYFGPTEENNNVWGLGRINLILRESEDPDQRYIGAIKFGEKVSAKVANEAFPLHVSFNPNGTIHFHILGASKDFNQDDTLPPEYRFRFHGTCRIDEDNKVVLSGGGGVPASFSPKPGAPNEDGEDVNWTSKGLQDPQHKPSR